LDGSGHAFHRGSEKATHLSFIFARKKQNELRFQTACSLLLLPAAAPTAAAAAEPGVVIFE
jgi:hypothetical protein